MNDKRIIITGGAGFIGSNLILHLFEKYPGIKIWNVDKLSYASDLSYLEPIADKPNYTFVQLDLGESAAVRHLVNTIKPEGVIHLAAESHVDNSISGPEPFVISNVVGTFTILDACRQLWTEQGTLATNRFHHVSTDEVYGTLGDEGAFTEQTPYAPNSPYSATKAGSDFLVRAYFHTYGMNVVTTNCSNNYGPHQHDEKLIPTVIRNAVQKNPIPIYGKGENVRDWLFVRDHNRAIELVFNKGCAGETYNIGGRNEWKNIDLVRAICQILDEEVGQGPDGSYNNLIRFVTDRPGHDFRYAIDAGKLERELGWQNTQDFRADLRTTVRWYVNKFQE